MTFHILPKYTNFLCHYFMMYSNLRFLQYVVSKIGVIEFSNIEFFRVLHIRCNFLFLVYIIKCGSYLYSKLFRKCYKNISIEILTIDFKFYVFKVANSQFNFAHIDVVSNIVLCFFKLNLL